MMMMMVDIQPLDQTVGENNDQTRQRMIAFFWLRQFLMIHYNGNDQNGDDYGQNDDDDKNNDDKNDLIIAVMMIGFSLTVPTWM